MGRPKKGTTARVAAAAAAAAAAVSEDDAPDAGEFRTANGDEIPDSVSEVLRENAATDTREARATVKRLNEEDQKYYTLDVVDAALANEEWIQRTYGGGKYRVYINGPNKTTGRTGFIRLLTFEVDRSVPFLGSIAGRNKAAMSPTLHNADGSVARRGDDDMALVFKSQILELVKDSAEARQRDREGSSAMLTMMTSMMAQQSQQNQQFMQLMMGLLTAQKNTPALPEMIGALAPLLSPVISSLTVRKDPLESATQLVALMNSSKPATNGLTDVIAAVKELRETADLFNNNEPREDDSLLGTVTRMLPQLLPLLTAQQQRELAATMPTAPVAMTPTIPAPSVMGELPLATVSADPSGVEDDMSLVLGMMRTYGEQLVERARNDDDPYDLGRSVASVIPITMRNAASAFALREDAAAQILAAVPALAPYPAWVNEFVEGVHDHFHGADDEDEDDAPDGVVDTGVTP